MRSEARHRLDVVHWPRLVAQPLARTYTRRMVRSLYQRRLNAAGACLLGQLLLLLMAPWAHAHGSESGINRGAVYHSHGAVAQQDLFGKASASDHPDIPVEGVQAPHVDHMSGPLRWTDHTRGRLRLPCANLDTTPLLAPRSVLTDIETPRAGTAQLPSRRVYSTCPRTSGDRARIVGADLPPPTV